MEFYGTGWQSVSLQVIWLKFSDGGCMETELILRNNLKQARMEKKLSQNELAKLVGVSRQTISSIETGVFNPTAKLALILCIALDKKFEELFYFWEFLWNFISWTRGWRSMPILAPWCVEKLWYRLFPAIYSNGLFYKISSSISAYFVNVVLEAFIRCIHFPQATKDFICTYIVVIGYKFL